MEGAFFSVNQHLVIGPTIVILEWARAQIHTSWTPVTAAWSPPSFESAAGSSQRHVAGVDRFPGLSVRRERPEPSDAGPRGDLIHLRTKQSRETGVGSNPRLDYTRTLLFN